MVVTWTTFNETESVVEYNEWGGKLFTLVAKGNAITFVDGGSEKRRLFIHRVTLSGLKPGSAYGECMQPQAKGALTARALRWSGAGTFIGNTCIYMMDMVDGEPAEVSKANEC